VSAARPALCIGKFDALHRGHRALAEAARTLGPPRLLRFTGMAEALGWTPRLPLVAESERAAVLAAWDAGEAILPFATVRDLDLDRFAALVAERFAACALVVGADFRGGRGRSADAAALAAAGRARGLAVQVVPQVGEGGAPISSSRIRALLAAGEVAAAAALLGRPHRLAGRVVSGDGRGRTLGFPTANCAERENVEPGIGVYAGFAEVAGVRRAAAINIGRLPTIGADRPLTVEAHLLGWDGDCYGERLVLEFHHRLRGEQRFASRDELARRIAQDVAAAGALTASR
jgi:riboflavin kinase/FMN adenylyltransferase